MLHAAPLRPAEQSTSSEFRQLLDRHHGVQSLSRKGECWDNAVAESFFATLKEEPVNTRSWANLAQVRSALFEYIEVFYNRRRLHSSLGYLTPTEYEANTHHHPTAHAA